MLYSRPSLTTILFLSTLLMLIQPWPLRAQGQYKEWELDSLYSTDATFESDGSTRVRIDLPEIDYSRALSRYDTRFLMAGPVVKGNPDVTEINGSYAVTNLEGDVLLRPNLGDEVEGLTVPATFMNPRLRLVDQFRGVNIYKVEISAILSTTMMMEEERQSIRMVFDDLDFRVNFPGFDESTTPTVTLESYDPYLPEALQGVIVNADDLERYISELPMISRAEELRAWNLKLQEAAERGPLLMSKLARGGFYSIDEAYLNSFGVDLGQFPVSRLHVYAGKNELPVLTENLTQDRLIGEAKMSFYVPEDKTGRKPYIPLWIMVGGSDEAPRRAEIQNITGVGTFDEEPTAYHTVTIFEPNHFHHDLDLTNPQLRWATADIPLGGYQDFEFQAVEPVPDEEVQLTIWAACDYSRGSSAYDVYINGEFVGSADVRSRRTVKSDWKAPSSILRAGTNILSLQPKEIEAQFPSGVTMLQAQLRIPSRFESTPVNTPVKLSLPEATSGTLTMTSNLRDSRSLLALDITDPISPKYYRTRNIRVRDQAGTGVLIELQRDSEVMLSSPEFAYSPPSFEEMQAPRSFLDTGQVDYLVIDHKSLSEATERLVNYRSESRSVAHYSVDDIYNAFAYGELSSKAIRMMVEHTLAAREGRRLSELLLIGEASEYWWEYRGGWRDVTKNLVPVYGWQDEEAKIRGDEEYVTVYGAGSIPDLEAGRISASTPEELEPIIDKIIEYETDPPPGDWKMDNVFFTDDEPEFLNVANDIVAKAFGGRNVPELLPQQSFPYENYFRGFWRKRSVVMTDKIVEALNKGSRTAVYLGHGGPNLWSGERIFHIRDIDKTQNDGRYPVLVAGSCDTGWLDYPVEPVQTSLSEHFLRRPNGGVIAAYIPVSGTSSFEHNFLLTGFYKALMRREIHDIGLVSLQSKLEYYVDRNNQTVTQQYLLMGDPALKVTSQPQMEDAEVLPEKLLSVTGGRLQFRAQAPDIKWGRGTARFYTKQFDKLAESSYFVYGGSIVGELEIPDYLEPGSYILMLTAESDKAGESYSARIDIPVAETRVRLEWITGSVEQELAMAGKPVQLPLLIANDSEFDMIGMNFELINGLTGQRLGSSELSLAAGSEVRPQFPQPIPVGMESIVARITVPQEDEYTEPVVLAESEFQLPIFSELVRFLSFPAAAIQARHLSGGRGTEFVIPVYNLTEVTLDDLRLRLVQQADEPTVVGEDITIESLPSGSRENITFHTERRFLEGGETLALEIYDQADETELPLQVEVFTLSDRTGPDLEIIPGSFVFENESFPPGTTVFVRFTARNVGGAVMNNVMPQLFVNQPWNAEKQAENSVPWTRPDTVSSLAPGEMHTFRMRWDPPENGLKSAELYATVESRSDVVELDLENNVASLKVNFLDSPNIKVLRDQLERSSQYVQPYKVVKFTVPFTNDTNVDYIRSFRVTAYAHGNDGGTRRLLNQRFEKLLAGESGTVQFDWVVQPRENRVSINVNEDREFVETSFDDNDTTLSFAYVINDLFFDEPYRYWDLWEFPDFAEYNGVRVYADGSLTTSDRPMAFRTPHPFKQENLISGRLGRLTEADDMWGIRQGNLHLAHAEIATEPLYFRMPLNPSDNSTYYDVYINHVGGYRKELNSGQFYYRIEGEEDWTLMNSGEWGEIYVGRYETADDVLDLHIRGAEIPSVNQIYNIITSAAGGEYLSPIVRFSEPARGRLLSEMEIPDRAHVEFAVRYGRDDVLTINWGDWLAVQPGEQLPLPAEEEEFAQVRAQLYDSLAGKPAIYSLRIEVPEEGLPDAEKPAHLTEQVAQQPVDSREGQIQ